MTTRSVLALRKIGLVTAVGMDAPSSCAAFRARVANPTPTRIMDVNGDWIMAHQVELGDVRDGMTRQVNMAALAAQEALSGVPQLEWASIPLLLCVAEQERPGRLAGLDVQLLARLQEALGAKFASHSSVLAQGRVSVPVAALQARRMLEAGLARQVLVVAVDSLVNWETLAHHDRADRLLREDHSNGFLPGEGAGALLLGAPTGAAELIVDGLGFGLEEAHLSSDLPLRASGLATAIKGAIAEAGCAPSALDYRMADLSGEQYYFKEAALAMARTMQHQTKEEFDLWHPAECIGEAGALVGAAMLAWAEAAARKGYAKGPRVLAHFSNDGGQRAAMTLRYGSV